MKVLSITDAVAETLAELIASKASFSAFDVTQKLREKVNAGILELAGLPKIANPRGTGTSQFIAHGDVRHEVHAQVDALLTTSYTKTNRKQGGNSFIFFECATLAVIDPFDTTAAAPAPTGPAPVAPTTPLATATTPIAPTRLHRPFDATEQGHAELYVTNRHAEGVNPTLKALQSRLKDVDVTCDELAAFFTTKGYTVVQPPDTTESYREVMPKV